MQCAQHALAARHRPGAMAADIGKCADDTILSAHDHQRLTANLAGEIGAGHGNLVGPTDELPRVAEHTIGFQLEDGGVGVPARWERRSAMDRFYRQLLRAEDYAHDDCAILGWSDTLGSCATYDSAPLPMLISASSCRLRRRH